MKKTLTILSLLSVLFLTACEEVADLDEKSSLLSQYSHIILSESESEACTINFVFDGLSNVIYRNGVIYDSSIENQEKYDSFPLEMVINGLFNDEQMIIDYTMEQQEENDLYTISLSSLGDHMATFTDVEYGEDENGLFVSTNIDCQEGIQKQVYRLGNVGIDEN